MIELIYKITDIQLQIGNDLRKDSIEEAKAIRIILYVAMGVILVVFIVMAVWLGFVYMNQG